MSFFSDKSPEDCWVYFDRHIAQIPNPQNAALVRKYLREREENAEYSTLGCYLGHLKAFSIYLGERAFQTATRDDVIGHIKDARSAQGRTPLNATPKTKPLGKYTKYQRMVMLREFYAWILDVDSVPEQFRRMPFTKPSLEEQLKDRHDRLSHDEIMQMLLACNNSMERCLVMLLADSGFRAGEASALDIGDIEFDEYGTKAYHHVSRRGMKSGRRKVALRLTVCTPYLIEWINEHPKRTEPETALFISRSNRNRGARLTASGVWSVITRLSDSANIRHVHPHMFRHTAASIRAGDGWGEEMMRLHFGWSKGSNMPSYYSHVEDDYDRFAIKKSGRPVPEPETSEWTTQCEQCGFENRIGNVFCEKCHRPISD